MNNKVLLDIDGVIAHFYKGFGQYLNKVYNTNLNIDGEPSTYSMRDWDPAFSKEDIDVASKNWILGSGFFKMPIYPGAKEFVYELMDLCDVYIVTGRINDYDMALSDNVKYKIRNDTKKWFKYHGIPAEKLFFAGDKAKFCNDNGIKILIEDKLSTVENAVVQGIESFLMYRKYNDTKIVHPRLHKVDNYSQIISKIREILNEPEAI